MEVNFYLKECTLFQDVYRTLRESTVLTCFILTSPKCPKYVHNDETFRGLSGSVTFRLCVCWVATGLGREPVRGCYSAEMRRPAIRSTAHDPILKARAGMKGGRGEEGVGGIG